MRLTQKNVADNSLAVVAINKAVRLPDALLFLENKQDSGSESLENHVT